MIHPYHYGPPPEPSGVQSGTSTPASEHQRRLSDPPNPTWDNGNPQWEPGPWGGDGSYSNEKLPQMAYGDGPPYSEDDDLHSPVIISSRRQKPKSSVGTAGGGNGKGKARSPPEGVAEEDEEDYFTGQSGGLYEDQRPNGFHKGLVTYPPDHGSDSTLAPSRYTGHRDSHFATTLPNRSYRPDEEASEDSEDDQEEHPDDPNDSRYSKDYQFTIASPDEEMHGKAVALFDFERENENELQLVEGQVIWVSYRHGQGWLVAEDPKSGDKGLVPEEYVRLLRDIEGGWNSLSGDVSNEQVDLLSLASAEPQSAVTPTQAEPLPIQSLHASNGNISNSNSNNAASDKRPPIVSMFSTSSKDLDPYPQHLLDKQAGQLPPQVVHYGSQANTPTIASPGPGMNFPRSGNSEPAASLLSKGDSFPGSEADESGDTEDSEASEDEYHDSTEQQKT
ncbi:MAG: hypothetical protein Q9220_002606 [cf. Caloplaca sp. 1 TL-2023]